MSADELMLGFHGTPESHRVPGPQRDMSVDGGHQQEEDGKVDG